jgi:SAM-dependent methyltransferase
MGKRHEHPILSKSNLFERMGPVYKLLVDEKARARREAPLLLELADRARAIGVRRRRPVAATPVLDLACGTGFHARLLAGAGFSALGLDFSASMLDEARRRRVQGPGRVEYRRANLLEPLPVKKPAPLALLLGNTLSVFTAREERDLVMRNVAAVLCPGGLLLCQILNYRRLIERDNVTVTRHGRVRGRETILTKVLQATEDGRVVLSMNSSQKNRAGEWESASEVSVLNPLRPEELVESARQAGLILESAWGDHAKSPFDESSSVDAISLFHLGR